MKIISGLLVMLMAVVMPVMAQEVAQDAGTSVTVTDESPAATPSAEAQTVMDLKMSAEGNVSLDFRDADIKNVLKVLAYKSGMNIIAGPEVVGQVNIQLKDVPWQKAMDVILSTYGYSSEQKGTVLMVTTVENMKKRREDSQALAEQEPVTTKSFVLNFSKAEDVVKTLDKMKTARGSINSDQRTNAVIVTDVISNVESITEVVKRLDTVTPQVLIEGRIIETTLTKQETLGMKWPSSIGGRATMPIRTHNFPWTTKSNTYMPGAEYFNPSVDSEGVVAKTITTDSNLLTYGTLSVNDLALALDILQSRTNTNVISNPRVVTLDNQPATITVGNKYPLPKYTYSDTQEKVIVSGWEYIEYGLLFNVTPHINGRGMITLDIQPSLSDSPSSVPFQFGTTTTNVPVLSTQSAKTNVMIRDGETLVIAGLIKDRKTNTVQKVPLLGSIPFLGKLFQHKTDSVVKTELMIFLTPHIITLGMDNVQGIKTADVAPAKEAVAPAEVPAAW